MPACAAWRCCSFCWWQRTLSESSKVCHLDHHVAICTATSEQKAAYLELLDMLYSPGCQIFGDFDLGCCGEEQRHRFCYQIQLVCNTMDNYYASLMSRAQQLPQFHLPSPVLSLAAICSHLFQTWLSTPASWRIKVAHLKAESPEQAEMWVRRVKHSFCT